MSEHHRLGRAALAVTFAVALTAGALPPDEDATALLARAADAAARAGDAWRGVVARETYVQKFLPWSGAPPREPSRARAVVSRTLVADLLLVFDADGPWELHRDVLEVDGRAVGDREERLQALFLSPEATARQRLRRVTEESARFNLGDITRTFNVPTFPLVVVHPRHRERFRFTVKDDAQADGRVREVRFEELGSPTLVRSTLGRDVRLRGRVFLDVDSGELTRAIIEPDARGVSARVDVTFEHVPGMPMRVPIRMWEWYHSAGPLTDAAVQGGRGVYNAYIEAVATYEGFRRYVVESREAVGEVKP